MPTPEEREQGPIFCNCGKELIYCDVYGMFCEDLCGYEDAKERHEKMQDFQTQVDKLKGRLKEEIKRLNE